MKSGKITIDLPVPMDGVDIPVPVEVIYHAQPADPQAGWGPHIIVDVISYPDKAAFKKAMKKYASKISYPGYATFEVATNGYASEIKAACEADAREG